MNGGEATAKSSSSAQVVELGQEEASSSHADDVANAAGKPPDVVVIAVDGSKQAEIAFNCTFCMLFSAIINNRCKPLVKLRTVVLLSLPLSVLMCH